MNPGRNRAAAVWPLIACLVLFALLAALTNPLRNFPMGDDWEYARTVQRLITTGQFYRSPVVQATEFFPALWGALFSAVLGFSFTTLRLSTLPLAAGTLAVFYLILGDLDLPPSRRLLGALVFMVAPLFVFNALSFMTDVPFLFWFLLGLWCSLRAFRRDRLSWLVLSSVCAALAFLTRQLGLALTASTALVVLAYRPRADWPRWLAGVVVVPVTATLVFYAWQAISHQTTWADATITDQGTLGFIFNLQLPAALGRRVVLMLVSLNLYMLPLWLAFWPHWLRLWSAFGRLSRWLRVLAGALVVFIFGSVTFFGARGDWWPYSRGSLTNAGLWPSLAYYAFPNDVRPPFVAVPFWAAMTYIGAALSVLLLLILAAQLAQALRQPGGKPLRGLVFSPFSLRGKGVGGMGESGRDLKPELARLWSLLSARLQRLGPTRALIYASFLALLALVLVYPLFVERYFLPFLPGAILLLLDATRPLRPSLPLAALSLTAVGLFSVGLMWDYYDWHAVRWADSQALVAQGVPLEKLDAGYEWNGWNLSDEAYAYIQAHGSPFIDDPFAYVLDPEYMVTFTLQPGYQVDQEWPFYSPFRPGGADHLLLLKRMAAQ